MTRLKDMLAKAIIIASKIILIFFVVFLVVSGLPLWAREYISSKLGSTTFSTSRTDLQDVKLNIFAVVSPEIENVVNVISRDLLAQEKLTTFPQLGYQIHCTLYMTTYPPAVQSILVERIKELASSTYCFPARASQLRITKDNWFFVDLERDRNLQSLSDTVVKIASPLRSKNTHIPEWAKNYPEKLEYIKQYGSPNVFAQFEPHLTLLANADAVALERFLRKSNQNNLYGFPITGKVVAIGIGEADRFGQIAKPIAIFPLLTKSNAE